MIKNCFLIVLLMLALLAFRHFVHAVFTFNVDLSFFFKTLAFLSSFVFIIKLRGRYRDFPIPLYPHIYIYSLPHSKHRAFPGGSDGKVSACSVGDPGLIPGLGRSPGEGNGNALQYSCLENSMDGGAWWATVHGAEKSQARLSNFTHS